MSRLVAGAVLVAVTSVGLVLYAEPTIMLRMACIAPDGSYWAHELHSFAERVDSDTGHRVQMKWYLNGIAGNEDEMLARMRRNQLAGAAFAVMCEQFAPSLRVTRLPALFQDREEAREILSRLQPVFAAEAHHSGIVLTGTGVLGADTIFTRVPVHSMAELRKLRMWRWDIDEAAIAGARAMGFNIVPLPIWDAARAYDEGKIDGFFVIPTAALAYQFSTRARYLTDLRSSYLAGCPVFTESAFYALTADEQAVVRDGVAVLRERTDAEARDADAALVGGLFKKQGVVPVPVSESFRADFFAAARAARDQLAAKYVDKQLLERVTQMLADYRAEHRANR